MYTSRKYSWGNLLHAFKKYLLTEIQKTVRPSFLRITTDILEIFLAFTVTESIYTILSY